MTQNQIAYWANVERERSNRAAEAEKQRSNLRNEEIASAAQVSKAALEAEQINKAKADTLLAQHNIVQGYYRNTPGSNIVKTGAGTVMARALGITDPYSAAKTQVREAYGVGDVQSARVKGSVGWKKALAGLMGIKS